MNDLGPVASESSKHADLRASLTVQNRGARRPRGRRRLRRSLAGRLPVLWRPAIETAIAEGDPIGQLVADELRENPSPELAETIARELNETGGGKPILELERVATEIWLDAFPSDETNIDVRRLFAILHQRLAFALARLGQLTIANERLTVAVDTFAHLPDSDIELAQCLSDRSSLYQQLGEPLLALEAADAAVETRERIYRRSRDISPHLLQDEVEAAGELASALAVAANARSALDQGDVERCLAQRAVELYDRYDDHWSTAERLRAGEARISLGNALRHAQRPREGHAELRRAVEVLEKLAAENPDLEADLALGLADLAIAEREIEPAQAQQTLARAIRLYRDAAALRPDAFTGRLAWVLGVDLDPWDIPTDHAFERALRNIDEAIALLDDLIDRAPEAWTPELVRALVARSQLLQSDQLWRESLPDAERAIALWDALPRDAFPAFARDAAWARICRAHALDALGASEEALAEIDLAIATLRGTNRAFGQRDLSAALDQKAAILYGAERFTEAAAILEASDAPWWTNGPETDDEFDRLGRVQLRLAMCRHALGDLEGSLTINRDAVAAFEALHPERGDAVAEELAMAIDGLTHRLVALGRVTEARAASDRTVEIFGRLSERGVVTNAAHRVSALSRRGAAYSTGQANPGDLELARSALEESVHLAREVYDAAPSEHSRAQIARCGVDLAIVLEALGLDDEARASCESILEFFGDEHPRSGDAAVGLLQARTLAARLATDPQDPASFKTAVVVVERALLGAFEVGIDTLRPYVQALEPVFEEYLLLLHASGATPDPRIAVNLAKMPSSDDVTSEELEVAADAFTPTRTA